MQTYARIAGALFLVSVVAGGFGEFLVPSMVIVTGDAAATANNILTSIPLMRLGFAAYLVEAVCDVSLTFLLYQLLRPVREDLALLAVFFRLVATAVFGAVELFFFAPLLILGGAEYLKTFSTDQLQTLALLSLRIYGNGSGLYLVLYGIPSILFGYLIYLSGYLPKILGVLMALSGAGFVIANLTQVLAPAISSSFVVAPAALGGLVFALWLLVRGVDEPTVARLTARRG